MSNALAIAGVSAVLKDLLDSGLIDHRVTDAMGKGVTVSATAPDNIELTGANATPRLNLFLHQVTTNPAWRNVGFPSHDGRGNRIANPPLALDLHYLLTAYGNEDLQAEVLLGYAMQLFHETPVLPRQVIRTSLNPSPVNGSILPSVYQALRSADLAEQLEQVKITPTSINTEEMSRLWSALQAHYRPTAAYQVSVVLIAPQRPARLPLPVLSRGSVVDPVTLRDRGVIVEPSLTPPVPMLESIEPPGGQPVTQLEDIINLNGHHLGGTNRAAVLSNARFQIDEVVPALAGNDETAIQFKLPATPAVFPVGIYLLAVRLQRPGESEPRTTLPLPLVLAPQITTTLPANVARNPDGTATITLNCRPEVRQGQQASLVLGERAIPAQPFTGSTATLSFRVADPPVGVPQLLRLRVDDIESPIIDRSAKPPAFFNHRVTIS
jgi:hypothetical protein